MGSNAAKKANARKNDLCYICEEKPAYRTDDVGGRICLDCDNKIAWVILRHYELEGFTLKK